MDISHPNGATLSLGLRPWYEGQDYEVKDWEQRLELRNHDWMNEAERQATAEAAVRWVKLSRAHESAATAHQERAAIERAVKREAA